MTMTVMRNLLLLLPRKVGDLYLFYRFNEINSFCIIVQASTSNNIDLNTNGQTSSTVVDPIKRERCPFGESCYRTNLTHRQQAIHPGDSDWDIKENEKNKTKPECPYGSECYRKNPDHFNEYYHSKKKCIEIKNKPRTTKRKGNILIDICICKKKKLLTFQQVKMMMMVYQMNMIIMILLLIMNVLIVIRLMMKKVYFIINVCLIRIYLLIIESAESDDDIEWKPDKNSRYADETDDDSSEESERELTNQEAAAFVKDSTSDYSGPVIKKPRIEEEDDN